MSKIYLEDVVSIFWRVLQVVSWAYFFFILIGGLAYRYLTGEQPPYVTLQLGISWSGILLSFVGPHATDDWGKKKKFKRLTPEEKEIRTNESLKKMEDIIESMSKDRHDKS